MERILALQSLSEFLDIEAEPANSTESGVCSLQSSGQGRSSCSISCGKATELDW
jgi:hypothetical protein